MKSLSKGILSLTLALGLFVPATADTYKIDGAHTKAVFTVKHLGISNVTGQFTKVNGSLDFDDFFTSPEKAKDAKTNAVIEVTSIDTGIPKRDDHLKSKDFFDATEYPDIKFTSKEVKVTGDKTFDILGDFTMHGVTKPVVLNAVYNGQAKDPFSGVEKIAFTANTKINRKDYGLTWNKQLETGNFLVGEEIDITLEVEADKQK